MGAPGPSICHSARDLERPFGGPRDLKDKWAEASRYSLSPSQHLPIALLNHFSGKFSLPRTRVPNSSGITWKFGCQKCYYFMVNHFSLMVVLKLQSDDINWLWFLLGKISRKTLSFSSFFL